MKNSTIQNRLRCLVSGIGLSLCLLLSGCAGSQERSLQAGQKALAQEKYADAVTAFEKAGGTGDAQRLLQYARAQQALADGSYEQAEAGFDALGDYKDSRLMVSYSGAREQEETARTAFSTGDAGTAIRACGEAYAEYSTLALFRDSDTRGANCRELLYSRSTEWMNAERYGEAAEGFAALADWKDCAGLEGYCRAAALEQEGAFVEAADLFARVPNVLDAGERVIANRERAYQQALTLEENGDFDAAIAVFTALDGYRDADAQRDAATAKSVQVLLRAGSYTDALQRFASLADRSVFPVPDEAQAGTAEAFLNSFLNVWLNAHAQVMSGFFSRSLLTPYVVPGGELEARMLEEFPDDLAGQNSGFVFYGAEIGEQRIPDEGFVAARVTGTASWFGGGETVNAEEDLWVLMDFRQGNPLAAAVISQ